MRNKELDTALKAAKSDHLLIENMEWVSTLGVRYDIYAVPAELLLYRGLPYAEADRILSAIVLVQALRRLGLRKDEAGRVLSDLLSQPGRLRASISKLASLVDTYRGHIYDRKQRQPLQLRLGRTAN